MSVKNRLERIEGEQGSITHEEALAAEVRTDEPPTGYTSEQRSEDEKTIRR